MYFLMQFYSFQDSYSDLEDSNAMAYVSVEDNDIKDEDFDVIDNSIYDEVISTNTLDIIPLKDQDEFENSENKPLKIQERKPKPHGCPECDKRFRKKSNLLGHMRRIHEGKMKKKIYKCSICSSTFTRNMSLTNHMATIHNIDYQCTICNEAFKTNVKLTRHLKLKHNVRKSFDCPRCDSTFSVRNSLKTHIARVHEKKKPHLCPECGKSFGGANTLKTHIEAIHEKKEFECTKCNEVYKTLYLYKAHMAFQHEGKEMHKCPMCDAELKSKQILRNHIAFMHEGNFCDRMSCKEYIFFLMFTNGLPYYVWISSRRDWLTV